METVKGPELGRVVWQDLTVENAEHVQRFYSEVIGWKVSTQGMGDYDDYNMHAPESGDVVAGICHARGPNARLPPQWLLYFPVDDVDARVRRCLELGGEVLDGPREMGGGRFAVIRDPAGAVAALFSPGG